MCADGTLYLAAGSVAECQDQRAKSWFPLAHHTKNFKWDKTVIHMVHINPYPANVENIVSS